MLLNGASDIKKIIWVWVRVILWFGTFVGAQGADLLSQILISGFQVLVLDLEEHHICLFLLGLLLLSAAVAVILYLLLFHGF